LNAKDGLLAPAARICGMNALLITFAITFVASLLLTVVVRSLARRLGIVDYPDGRRKLHKMPISLWGGVAVYLALVLGLCIARFGSFGVGQEYADLSTVLIIATGIVCACGAVDDCWCLNSRFKLALQICSVLPIIAFGYTIHRVVAFGYPIELGWLGVPITALWLVGCINALNLLDGMDGLSSMVGLLTAAMMGIIAVSLEHNYVTVIAVVLVASLAGFLIHNLPPASIFLGDSGSMVIGLVLGVLGMQGAMKTSATLAITIPAIVMSLPMFDTVLALVRRRMTGRRFDVADREHIHHRLLDRGLSQWQTLCLLGAWCLATGAAATAATIFRNDALAWITAVTLIALMIRLRLFGHHELALVKNAVARHWVMLLSRFRLIRSQHPLPHALNLRQLSFDQTWDLMVNEAKASQAGHLALTLSHKGEYLHRQGWRDPSSNWAEPWQWSIATTSCRQEGEFCEICASGAEAMDPSLTLRLTGVLRACAAHFAMQIEQIPEGVLLGDESMNTGIDPQHHRKAA
jgi:UDP-GlcNAc:undecaprenyl-phosphate/decaprenyl-phosphate GlcNAc-1-phosphate transferase